MKSVCSPHLCKSEGTLGLLSLFIIKNRRKGGGGLYDGGSVT